MPRDGFDGHEYAKQVRQYVNGSDGDTPAGALDTFTDDDEHIAPRGWLLGTAFCRGFISGTVGAGGSGKTAIRHAQLLSLATGRSLTGEHLHQRARVLIVSLEDGQDELRRRIRAARLHHGISTNELDGWLHLATPGGRAGKLMELGEDGTPTRGALYETVCRTIEDKHIDVVSFDPFVKLHSLEENSNSAIDDLMVALTDIADQYGVAVDLTHHTRKGVGAPGDAEVGRGASAVKDAMRLLSTVATMTDDEAKQFEIPEHERRKYVRLDSGKVNIAPAAGKATWYKLIGVRLDNATEAHPAGDTVQTVEPWQPPDAWQDVTCDTLNRILDDIAAGLPDGTLYSDANSATSRAAWKVVQKHAPAKSEHQARTVIRTWVKNGVLISEPYRDPSDRKERHGLTVNDDKRPGDIQP